MLTIGINPSIPFLPPNCSTHLCGTQVETISLPALFGPQNHLGCPLCKRIHGDNRGGMLRWCFSEDSWFHKLYTMQSQCERGGRKEQTKFPEEQGLQCTLLLTLRDEPALTLNHKTVG